MVENPTNISPSAADIKEIEDRLAAVELSVDRHNPDARLHFNKTGYLEVRYPSATQIDYTFWASSKKSVKLWEKTEFLDSSSRVVKTKTVYFRSDGRKLRLNQINVYDGANLRSREITEI